MLEYLLGFAPLDPAYTNTSIWTLQTLKTFYFIKFWRVKFKIANLGGRGRTEVKVLAQGQP